MFKLIKWLFIAGLAVFIFLILTGYKVQGKGVLEYLSTFFSKSETKEAVKDIRTMVGEAIKSVGDQLSGDISDEDRAKLNQVLKDELEGKKDEKSGEEPAKKDKDNAKPQKF